MLPESGAAISDISCSYLGHAGASINRQSMTRLRFPTIPTFRRSIVLHVNYLQKINLKRVGADLLLTIYRFEKSFVTRRVQCNEKRPSAARLAGARVACGICGQFLRKYNELHAVIRPKVRNCMSICGLADPPSPAAPEREARVGGGGD